MYKALTGFAVVAALALVPLPYAAAQAPPGMMARGMMGLSALPRLLDAPIPGHPFNATAEVSFGQGKSSPVQMARDADGRTYLKATLPARPAARNPSSSSAEEQAREVIVIADPVAHKEYFVFSAAKNIEVHPLHPRPPMAAATMAGLMPGRGRGTTTTLGTRKIAGQSAQGLKTVVNVPARGNRPTAAITREIWRSPSLQLVLEASVAGASQRQMSFTVQSLHTGAPDAALFQLPAGYTLEAAPARRGFARRSGPRRPATRPPA